MLENTQPSRRLDRFQTVRPLPVKSRPQKRLLPFILLALVIVYFMAPFRTNILLLGTDDAPDRGTIGRTDTVILISIVPLKPYIRMLSIPRDLWIPIPGIGEQRINTAYFLAEANQPGSGTSSALETVHENFNVPVRYYAIIHMLGLVSVVDALGGVDVHLKSAIGGYAAGTYHLARYEALTFVRERNVGDDFGRMVRTQILLSATVNKMLNPSAWHALPQFVSALMQTVETNVPLWQWPRLLFALLRSFIFG